MNTTKPIQVLMVDNYDSFTYNLVQYFGELGADVEVHRNDEITVAEIETKLKAGQLDRLVISPGPCSPPRPASRWRPSATSPVSCYPGGLPGPPEHRCGAGRHHRAGPGTMHGKTSVITTTQQGVFAGLPQRFTVNRYHSLAIRRSDCPSELEVTAWTDDGEIMGVKHKTLPIEGVQFHPESILTEHGHAMLKNFLEQA